ncbi:hypothetical protein F5Y16DRAFT_386240 [Xylariaceae sp. FL0255]|nr:hypothetical protein F5Y16DRAFT_386240 [Xylariaceae sp. FL0255]
MAPSATSCSICCHCGTGISYNKYYFLCAFCDLCLCNGCHGKHPQTHRPGFRRCMDKMRDPNTPDQRTKCSKCAGPAEIRFECNACDIKLCFGCWPSEAEGFVGHEHKAYTFIHVPGDRVIDKVADMECGSCLLGSSLSHCTRCLEGIMEGDQFYECLGCLQSWHECQSVCASCYPIVQQEHFHGHQWYSLVFREIQTPDEKYCGGKCMECGKKMAINEETKLKHPHKTFAIEMGCVERQLRSHISYRRCPRRAVKNIDVKDEDMHKNIGCHVCFSRFPKESKFYQCLKCDFSACPQCHEHGIANHPHSMFAAYIRGSTPAEDFWTNLLTEDNSRWCDICKEKILPQIQTHLRCRKCMDYDICQGCMSKEGTTVAHACGEFPEQMLLSPDEMEESWYNAQLAKAQQFVEEQEERMRQEAAVAEATSRKAAADAEARRKAEASTAQRQAAAARAAPRHAPMQHRPAPARQQAARPKSSGMAFLKGALQITNAVLKAENRMINTANGGGGGGITFNDTSGSSGGGMDMSSFWAPINSAAQDPIQ